MSKKILIVSGNDANTFLQNFITCDINNAADDPMPAASCTQKGRVVATFKIQRKNGKFYLSLPQETIKLLLTHFKKFVFRSNVTFEIIDDKTASQNWRLKDIQSAFPNIFPQTSELFTPHMLNLIALGGVSFNKGCYLGQEIIARTEHLGKTKRCLQHIVTEEKSIPTPGSKISINHGVNRNQENIVIDAVMNESSLTEMLVVN